MGEGEDVRVGKVVGEEGGMVGVEEEGVGGGVGEEVGVDRVRGEYVVDLGLEVDDWGVGIVWYGDNGLLKRVWVMDVGCGWGGGVGGGCSGGSGGGIGWGG